MINYSIIERGNVGLVVHSCLERPQTLTSALRNAPEKASLRCSSRISWAETDATPDRYACCCKNHGCHRFDVKRCKDRVSNLTKMSFELANAAIWMGAYSLTPRHLNFGADCLRPLRRNGRKLRNQCRTVSTPASHLTIYFNKRHPKPVSPVFMSPSGLSATVGKLS